MSNPLPSSFAAEHSADSAWLDLMSDVYRRGLISAPRGKTIKEMLATTLVMDMTFPVVTVGRRRLSYKFMAAEAWWICSGRNDVASIAPYNKIISSFSDDGVTFFGAYGVKAGPQMDYIVDLLIRDPDSRQAVINIWRESPASTKDVPCTISVQWFIRDHKLHCIDTMRSNDLWLGTPYDVFNFAMLSACLLLRLRERGVNLELGMLFLRAGSAHLYEPNWGSVESVLAQPQSAFYYAPFNPNEFSSEEALLTHLKRLADRQFQTLEFSFLAELLSYYASQNN